MREYYSVTTKVGDAAIANAITNNKKLNITHVAFGDGNGSVPTPDKNRTTLVHEVHRQAVNKYTQHETVANWITVEVIIPSNIGGFYIREMGIIADNVLISDGSIPPTYKEASSDGVREYRLRLTIDMQSADVVSLILDESLIYASQKWVDDNYIRRNELVDNLTTSDSGKALSAKQGKVLQDTKFKADGATGWIENGYPEWNAKSGVYANIFNGGSNIVLHFGGAGLSSPAIQFESQYANGPLRYRTARDTAGFTAGWTKVVTETDGNAPTATKLATSRTVSFSGAATGSFAYDGSSDSSCILTLANSGVLVGTYGTTTKIPTFTVNSKGLITVVSEKDLPIVNNLTTGGAANILSAEQGQVLNAQKLGVNDNAASATKLNIARTINGTNFDGTVNIEVPAYYGVVKKDDRIIKPVNTPANQLSVFFTSFGGLNSASGNSYYGDFLTLNTYGDVTGGQVNGLFFPKNYASRIYHFKADQNATAWGDAKQIAYTDDNVDFSITKTSPQFTLVAPNSSTAQHVLSNMLRSIAIAANGNTGDFVFWDGTNQKTLMFFAKDGNNASLNQYLAINTPKAENNPTGTVSFLVSGGESSPIKFKINQSSTITKNAPVGTAALNHAISFNWYATEWQIGNLRGASTDSMGFAITKNNNQLVWRHDGATQYNYADIYNYGGITSVGNVTAANLITNSGIIGAPNTEYHYIDVGKDGSDRTIFGQYGGVFYFKNTSADAYIATMTPSKFTLTPQLSVKQPIAAATITGLGAGDGSAIIVPAVAFASGETGYAPFMHGSTVTTRNGYVSQVSMGAYRGSDTWGNFGAYIAIGGSDAAPTEAFLFQSGGLIRSTTGAVNFEAMTATTASTGTLNVGNQLAMTAAPGGWTNNGLYPGNGDGASFATANFDIRTHYGLGIRDNNGNRNIVFNARTGDANLAGQLFLGGGATRLISSSTGLEVTDASGANAKGIKTGGVLASDSWSDYANVPTNGIYAKGDIKTAAWIYASRFVGALGGNADTATKLQTSRNINFTGSVTGSVSFDGSTDVTCNLSNPDLDILPYLPQPYPKTIPPSGYLSLAGQAITQAQYPKLYGLYGATLPDLRGEFIRGFDNGRGIDSGRSILSWQQDAIRNITGTYQSYFNTQANAKTGAFYDAGSTRGGSGGNEGYKCLGFDASRVVPTASENRPRNIAFNYIVKAG